MEIISKLIEFDKQLLLLINSFNNGFFDTFMYTFSKVAVWIPFYASVLYILFKSEGKKAIWLVLFLVLGVVLADQISVFIKNYFHRFRPSHDPVIANFVHIVNNSRAGLYGFVSSHAANTVGFATLSSLFIKNKNYSIAVFSWAAITCYSRIYLGLHFPGDILGGALTGIAIALFLYFIAEKFILKRIVFSAKYDNKVPIVVLLMSVVAISVYALLY